MPLVMFTTARRITFATGLALGLTLGVPLGATVSAHADPDSSQGIGRTPAEDDPAFSCVDDGNHLCGPGNANGVPASLYDEGGVLIYTWDQLIALGIVKVA